MYGINVCEPRFFHLPKGVDSALGKQEVCNTQASSTDGLRKCATHRPAVLMGSGSV